MTKRLTYEIVMKDSPGVYLTWTEDAVIKWLKNNGFDLTKAISRETDMTNGDIIFMQE